MSNNNTFLGQNMENVQLHNRSLVIQKLTENDIMTRVQLANQLGLQQATISKIIGSMISQGIVSEVGNIEGRMGRRSIAISLNHKNFNVIGVKLAREAFMVGTFNLKGEPIRIISQAVDSNADTPEFVIAQIKSEIDQQIGQCGNVCAIGIAVPGPYMKHKGRFALISEQPLWTGYSILDAFENAYDIPVVIEHDANAGAVALWRFGNYRKDGIRSLTHLLASEGIGAGILYDGEFLEGADGIAGEIGHITVDAFSKKRCPCGNYGCLEMFCSAHAMVAKANEEIKGHPESVLNNYSTIKVKDIFAAAKEGDAFSRTLVEYSGKYLGVAVADIINLYNPDAVIISDIMTGGGDYMLDIIRTASNERCLPEISNKLRIEYYTSDTDLILLGAAAIAITHIIRNPTIFYKYAEE